jgi:CRISPR-associated protein Cst1
MLQYTGHPLIDVGAAAMAAFAGKDDPTKLNEEDYARVADFIERQYTVQPLKSFLNVAFLNAGFTQPAFESQPAKRLLYAQKVARGYSKDAPTTDEMCVFTGELASAVSFSVDDSLPVGRVFREHVPMLTGRGVINFLPGGDAGLPVSGLALLAIQFFPMGCAKSAGKLLAVHSDNPQLIWHFAKTFLDANRAAILQAQQAGSSKMPEAHRAARTLLIETLLQAEIQRCDAEEEEEPSSVTAYHMTNSGQSNPLDGNNPPLNIYHLPMEITGFLATVSGPDYKQAWNNIVQRAWQLAPVKKARKADDQGADAAFVPRRNSLYEDLFRLPEIAPRFVRTYFLRLPRRKTAEDDPTRGYSLRHELDLVSWPLVELFLRKVIRMDQQRIDDIRTVGDRLATYVHEMDDKRFFRNFFIERNASNFRTHLIKANMAFIRAKHPPLFDLDSYIKVFEEGEEVLRPDWRLARDLVFIRMLDQLYKSGWIGQNPDLVAEAAQEREAQETPEG